MAMRKYTQGMQIMLASLIRTRNWYKSTLMRMRSIDMSVITHDGMESIMLAEHDMAQTAMSIKRQIAVMKSQYDNIVSMIEHIERVAKKMATVDLSVGSPQKDFQPGDMFVGIMSDELRRLYRLHKITFNRCRKYRRNELAGMPLPGGVNRQALEQEAFMLGVILDGSIIAEHCLVRDMMKRMGRGSHVHFIKGWRLVMRKESILDNDDSELGAMLSEFEAILNSGKDNHHHPMFDGMNGNGLNGHGMLDGMGIGLEGAGFDPLEALAGMMGRNSHPRR